MSLSLSRIVHVAKNLSAKGGRRFGRASRRLWKQCHFEPQVNAVKTYIRVTLPGRTRMCLHRYTRRAVRLATWPANHRPVIAARYYAHDWVLSNRTSRKLHAQSPPRLDRLQQEVVSALMTHGIAVVPFERFFGDDAVWRGLACDAASFKAQAESTADMARDAARPKTKHHLHRRHPRGVRLRYDDCWLRLGVSCRLLDVVNAYLGLRAKLVYIDQWFTPPVLDGERVSSQRWHRDFTDRHLVKVFIYLSDVDENAGPFEYVSESATGRYSHCWKWRPLGEMYPPADQFERAVPPSAIRTVTGKAGTVIFSNTSGFHRGGYATTTPRLMAVFNYASPASLHSLTARNFQPDTSSLPDDLPPSARFALS